jgi:pyruvate,water dikinase
MTIVAPLAAAVVERRGGMLIHGAIIAREYGLPCVTGVPDATRKIKTGDTVSVDGWLGIVTIL